MSVKMACILRFGARSAICRHSTACSLHSAVLIIRAPPGVSILRTRDIDCSKLHTPPPVAARHEGAAAPADRVCSIVQRELLVGAILTLGTAPSKGGVRWPHCSTPAPRHASKPQRAFRSMRRVSAGLGRKNSRCNARAVATRTNSWSVRPISTVSSKIFAPKPGPQRPWARNSPPRAQSPHSSWPRSVGSLLLPWRGRSCART